MMFRSMIGLCCLGSAAVNSQALAVADIQVLAESDTVLVMLFVDAPGAQSTLTFTRATANDLWEANVSGGEPGVLFGGTPTRYAGASSLRSRGISVRQSVQTFDSTIANRSFDNLTIFRLYAGDIAIALWQENSITEIWYVGSFVDDLLIPPGPADTCEMSLNACCRLKSVGSPANQYPWPTNSACVAVINNCGPTLGLNACNCLSAACAFCNDGTPDPLCDDIPGLEDRSSEACTNHTNRCPGGGPMPAGQSAAADLLAQVLDRTQVVRDIDNP